MITNKSACPLVRVRPACRPLRAVPDDAPPLPDARIPTPETYSKTTFSTSSTLRSHPLECKAGSAGKQKYQPAEWLLGGAALAILAGIASSVFHQRPAAQAALPAQSALTPPNELKSVPSPAVAHVALSSPSTAHPGGDAQQQAFWWVQEKVFIIADQGDQRDPSSSGPILVQALDRAVMPAFQDQVTAEAFAVALRAWNRDGGGVFAHRTADHAGQFHVVMLTPADLNIHNVPNIVLVPQLLLSTAALASPEAWRVALESIAQPQLDAWDEYIAACEPAPLDQPGVELVMPRTTSPADLGKNTSEPTASRNNTSEPTGASRLRESASAALDSESAGGAASLEPCGPPVPPPASAAAPRAPAQGQPETAASETSAAAPSVSEDVPMPSEGNVRLTDSGDSVRYPGSGLVEAPWEDAAGAQSGHSSSGAAAGLSRAPGQSPQQQEAHTGPKVYASVADLEADKPWDAAFGADSAGDRDGAVEPEEELRLLSEEETDASAVHPNPAALQAVFVPVLMRSGGVDGEGMNGEDAVERMMFTVDATLEQDDADVVALAFEDPIDATALLSMLAHVPGFTDSDRVVRRVVPMPPAAAGEAAMDQGASLLCMARGFQSRAHVHAGRDINGVLSRIAGARWASLMQQQTVLH